MNRKDFLRSTLFLCTPVIIPFGSKGVPDFEDGYVMTVNGPVSTRDIGFTLSHEHIMVDFIGADEVTPARYDTDDVFVKSLPHLKQAGELGCKTLVECTPAWLGRDVLLMRRLAIASGLHIITNTGYYGASAEKFLPIHAHSESAEQLAARWIGEWKDGIDGSGIKPGFIKIGVDGYPLSAVQRKLVAAAALTHLETGLTIGIHTGSGAAAQEELNILKNMGVAPEAWIWIHAQNELNSATHINMAKEGAWVSFDGLSDQSVDTYIQFLTNMKTANMLHKVLVSHDAGWYHVGEPDGGNYRPYHTVFTALIPALRKSGFSDAEINLIFIKNPAHALAVRIR
ncbi:MAG TPA: hypothetical protein VNQ80_02540 [Parapedobacter sp.]|uniref:phosphotriesterase family protein n=1 Tax=Parapedobacter sp. TaxID=1958893 RepID=UPI002C3D3DB7|nr:hypothetical protein [Parapedobacter sp.]HWK56186.1 hypothetical protein [Parapedobacter sp.]